MMLEERHEIVEFAKKVPLKLFIHNLGDVTKHWHKSIELLMVLSGTVEITMEDSTTSLSHGDVILINSNHMHELHSEGCVMLAAQINRSLLDESSLPADDFYFYCNSVSDKHTVKYDNLKRTIAEIVKSNSLPSESQDYINISYAYKLFSQLIDDFKVSGATVKKSTPKLQRLTQIIDFIDKNYADNITLTGIAEMVQLSAPYLSSFFEKNMGMTFSAYYSETKLVHAVEDLLGSSDSIEAVAARNGYPEPHAFVRAFKKKYGLLPSIYRKRSVLTLTHENKRVNYLDLKPGSYLHLLAEYLPDQSHSLTLPATAKEIDLHEVGLINVNNVQKQLNHHFKKVIGVAKAKDLLQANIQTMLTDLQQTVGYEFVRFHGMLSDDMLVCRRENGILQFRFGLIDAVIDFLASIKLKPMIQLSFMPEDIARHKNKTVFSSKFIISEPEDMNEWNALITALTRHLTARYGQEEVRSWLFSVWNEPDTSDKLFGLNSDEIFYDLYKNTFDTVKQVDSQLQFGSPSLLPLDASSAGWMEHFLLWTKENACCPDFLEIHYYSDIFRFENNSVHFVNIDKSSELSKDENRFSHFIASQTELIDKLGLSHLPLFMTEWGLSVSHRNLMNDTCFKSCYTIKNLLENYDRLASFGYWSLTDLIEENILPDETFHGGMGLYTMNGIRKSVFYAFSFASRLGSELLYADSKCFVTKCGSAIRIICYNYEHFNNLFADGEMFDMTVINRYTPFNKKVSLQIEIPLTGLNNGDYIIKEYFVNQNAGSAFDQWVEMGGLPIDNSDKALLVASSAPGFRQSSTTVEASCMTFETVLQPLEIRLIEIYQPVTSC